MMQRWCGDGGRGLERAGHGCCRAWARVGLACCQPGHALAGPLTCNFLVYSILLLSFYLLYHPASSGYSGSDMKNLVKAASMGPLREALRLGIEITQLKKEDMRPVTLQVVVYTLTRCLQLIYLLTFFILMQVCTVFTTNLLLFLLVSRILRTHCRRWDLQFHWMSWVHMRSGTDSLGAYKCRKFTSPRILTICKHKSRFILI